MTVEHFDQWYSEMSGAGGARDEFVRRYLGLPPELESTSLLSFDGLLAVRDILGLSARDVLLDLACGRGGYGLWLARETGARLIGIDISRVAIGLARERVGLFGLPEHRAEFGVGSLEATGLPDASVDAVLCVDAIQFADDVARAVAEMRRVLRPAGTVVVTCWEAIDRADERLPERIRAVDLHRQFTAAGIVEVAVEERGDWAATEESLWTAVAAAEPGDDAALRSLRDEAEQVLPVMRLSRRVLATGRAPRPGSAYSRVII